MGVELFNRLGTCCRQPSSEEKPRKLPGKVGFDTMLEFLARRPKADKDNLTDAQKAQLKRHVEAIIDEFA